MTKESVPLLVTISTRDLKGIISSELYVAQTKMKLPDDLPNDRIEEIARVISSRAFFYGRAQNGRTL